MPCSKVVLAPQASTVAHARTLSLLKHETWSDDGHGYVLHILHFTAETRPGM